MEVVTNTVGQKRMVAVPLLFSLASSYTVLRIDYIPYDYSTTYQASLATLPYPEWMFRLVNWSQNAGLGVVLMVLMTWIRC